MNEAWADFLKSVLVYVQGLGPGITGYVMATIALAFTLWVLAYGARSYSRHMTSVVTMSESLRKSMLEEKERCEERCRECERTIAQLRHDREVLIRDHSQAREEFLQEARERETIQVRLMDELEAMKVTCGALKAELDAIRAGTRSEQR